MDARAYAAVLEALRLPGTRPAGGQRQEALLGAALVPLEIARIGARVAVMAVRLAEAGNPNLRGDAVTGAVLAAASARSAASLVDINTSGWASWTPTCRGAPRHSPVTRLRVPNGSASSPDHDSAPSPPDAPGLGRCAVGHALAGPMCHRPGGLPQTLVSPAERLSGRRVAAGDDGG